MKENMDDLCYNGRLVMDKNDVTFFNDKGQPIDNLKEYFEKRKLANITCADKLEVGDVVKLKDALGRIVVVKYVDYKFNDNIKSDYAGTIYNSDGENLILFGQDDIDKVYVNEFKSKTL